MCISLTSSQELQASTVITNSFGNTHNITYLMEIDGKADKIGHIGGFIIFPGLNPEFIESPTVNSIMNYKADLTNLHSNGSRFSNYQNDKKINQYISCQTKLYNSLASLNDSINIEANNKEELKVLFDQLARIIDQNQIFILCLFPINIGFVSFSYTIKGELIIPGWENDHEHIEHLHPVVERKTTFIIGKTNPSQPIKYKQPIPSYHTYCFPSEVVIYSDGLEESSNGNLKVNTNQFGWNHLQVI